MKIEVISVSHSDARKIAALLKRVDKICACLRCKRSIRANIRGAIESLSSRDDSVVRISRWEADKIAASLYILVRGQEGGYCAKSVRKQVSQLWYPLMEFASTGNFRGFPEK